MAGDKQYKGESRRQFNKRKSKKGSARKKANRTARRKYK